MPNSPLEERLEATVSMHEKTVALGNHFYGSEAHLELMRQAAALIRSLRDERDRLREALGKIAAMETGRANATVRRMSRKARSTLSSLGEGV